MPEPPSTRRPPFLIALSATRLASFLGTEWARGSISSDEGKRGSLEYKPPTHSCRSERHPDGPHCHQLRTDWRTAAAPVHLDCGDGFPARASSRQLVARRR